MHIAQCTKTSISIPGTFSLISLISSSDNSLAKTILFTPRSFQNFTAARFMVELWVLKCNGIFGRYFLMMLNVPGSEKMMASAPQSAICFTVCSNILISVFLGKIFIVSNALLPFLCKSFTVFLSSAKSRILFCLILSDVNGTPT